MLSKLKRLSREATVLEKEKSQEKFREGLNGATLFNRDTGSCLAEKILKYLLVNKVK